MKSIKQGRFRGEKVRFEDGVGCCIWIPFKDEDMGICFDFIEEDIDDLIALLRKLKSAKPIKHK